jgi:hypothetical protein
MKELLKPYYLKAKDLLLKADSDDVDLDEIRFEVERLQQEFYDVTEKHLNPNEYKHEGEDAVCGLFEKFERHYGEDSQMHNNRDVESCLSIYLDWGFEGSQPQNIDIEEDSNSIQKKITTFISQRVKTPEDEFQKPILTGIVKTQITSDQMKLLVNNLTELSHSFNENVDFYDKGNWNWKRDFVFIAQYVFEKAAELTYKVVFDKRADEWRYDITDSFTYFQIAVTEDLQEKIDGEVCKLQDILIDIMSFVERNDYNKLDKDTWFRPIIFNIGLEGMLFTLENL